MTKLAIPANTFDPDLLVSGSAKKALETAGAAKTEGFYYASPDELRVIPGFNVRVETPDYLEHVESVALSIKENGFYPNKPLGGYAGKDEGKDVIFVTDGHTRLRAVGRARELGAEIDKVPVVLKPPGTSIEDLTVALLQDNEGRPLSVMERAIVASRLKSFNMSDADIARRMGKTERYVDDLLVLAGAPKKVRDFVIGGKVSATEAVKQVRKNAERAGDVLLVAVQTAGAAGKARASAKHVKASNGEPVKTSTEKFNFGWSEGQIVSVEEIKPVARVLDGAWWDYADDEKKTVKIGEALTISVKVTRTKPLVAAEENIEAAPAPAKPKASKPKAPAKAKKAPQKPAKPKAAPKAPPAAVEAPTAPAPVEDHGL